MVRRNGASETNSFVLGGNLKKVVKYEALVPWRGIWGGDWVAHIRISDQKEKSSWRKDRQRSVFADWWTLEHFEMEVFLNDVFLGNVVVYKRFSRLNADSKKY